MRLPLASSVATDALVAVAFLSLLHLPIARANPVHLTELSPSPVPSLQTREALGHHGCSPYFGEPVVDDCRPLLEAVIRSTRNRPGQQLFHWATSAMAEPGAFNNLPRVWATGNCRLSINLDPNRQAGVASWVDITNAFRELLWECVTGGATARGRRMGGSKWVTEDFLFVQVSWDVGVCHTDDIGIANLSPSAVDWRQEGAAEPSPGDSCYGDDVDPQIRLAQQRAERAASMMEPTLSSPDGARRRLDF